MRGVRFEEGYWDFIKSALGLIHPALKLKHLRLRYFRPGAIACLFHCLVCKGDLIAGLFSPHRQQLLTERLGFFPLALLLVEERQPLDIAEHVCVFASEELRLNLDFFLKHLYSLFHFATPGPYFSHPTEGIENVLMFISVKAALQREPLF